MAKKKTTAKTRKKTAPKKVEAITHDDASRKNIPTAEYQSVMTTEHQSPIRVAYERRNRDLDPQLVWRGKDEQDWSDLVVQAPPLFIQEKVHPKVLVDDLRRRTEADERDAEPQMDLFADFNGVPEGNAKTEFYQHDANWTNRMILGDSLQVMASLAEREGLRGKVQCIYLDPPYGIKFNSNFQWSTTSRDVKDGKKDHITREPEQVKAFRDTWRDGIHTYLTYLRDRLTVSHDLLNESGSIFVQIGDENVHRVLAVLDEVFGPGNRLGLILFKKTGGLSAKHLASVGDYILWYGKDASRTKFRPLFKKKLPGEAGATQFRYKLDELGNLHEVDFSVASQLPAEEVVYHDNFTSQKPAYNFEFAGRRFTKPFKPSPDNLPRVSRAGRFLVVGNTPRYLRKLADFPVYEINELWDDLAISGFADQKVYVVQTSPKAIERCLLMASDPGDLVLDPTCGSGTTAYVAEQWGRRWITIDTSRVSLALARARIMGARYPFFLLADSKDGVEKEAAVTRSDLPEGYAKRHYAGNVRHGFVYERVPHIGLKAIANNAEIDVIWEKFEAKLQPVREKLTGAIPAKWLAEYRKRQKYTADVPAELQEWEIPREQPEDWPGACKTLLDEFWKLRIARQKEIDASIAAKADFEYLYDKPYEDKKKVRVAGPFTVESISPHRTLGVDEDDELIDPLKPTGTPGDSEDAVDFVEMVLENLRSTGVQQAHKEDRILFSSLTPWPGHFICAEGRYVEADSDTEKRAGILIGPEFGTVSRQDLVAAAREAGDAGFDVLIACAFSYEAHATEFSKLGRIPVLKARMNAELHMGGELKNTGKGNLFVIFGEPDIGVYEGGSKALEIEVQRRQDRLPEIKQTIKMLETDVKSIKRIKDKTEDQVERLTAVKTQLYNLEREKDRANVLIDYAPAVPKGQLFVELYGVDVFHPSSGEVLSDSADGIACWFIDTDYNEESFFVRHAYFLGQSDPYKALKTTLKAEINEEAWATLNSDTSRPFKKPKGGRIGVKVINHLGDEVMKVFRVE
ncbi:MAG: site-specific DNA-methyltransferase [Phycisphaeraceae bacterium]|nr:site-specific DNA-methyltransferase [Phycisphaeraceae bacterium]